MEKTISVNGTDYEIVELLGRGKGGYSYLASSCDRLAVLKQIHHEPCDFYTFGNKLESEKNAYSRLKEVGIRIPDMISVDDASEIIVKVGARWHICRAVYNSGSKNGRAGKEEWDKYRLLLTKLCCPRQFVILCGLRSQSIYR